MKRIVIIFLFVTALLLYTYKPGLTQDVKDYFSQANSMLVSGNVERAVELYKTAIQQDNSFSEAYLGLGMAYKEQGKYAEAYLATKKAIELKPRYYQAYYNLGLVLEKQNRCSEAVNAYNIFLDEVPGSDKFTDAKQRISRIKNICK